VAQHLEFDLRESGIKDAHVFVQDPEFAKVLKNHYGFKPAVGEALVYVLGEENG